jgi:hypothetical protein
MMSDSSNKKDLRLRRRTVAAVAATLALISGILAATASPPRGAEPPALQPAAGEPLAGLTAELRDRFFAGRERFIDPIEIDEGLGPIMYDASCASCHFEPIGGPSGISVSHFGFIDGDGNFDPLIELGGTLLQPETIGDCLEEVPEEANIGARRGTAGALGYGLIEAIDEADLIALENDPPSPHVSGRVHWVRALEDPDGAPLRAGRFGWKATHATVLSFSASAARDEIGLTNRLLPDDAAPNGDLEALAECDHVADPEDGPHLGDGLDFIDRVTDFQRYLAPPPQTPRSGMTGEAIFINTGCADCHVRSFTTRDDPELEPVLRDREIRPYSDFLLHDMGELSDIPQGDASASEFRTTPLWGLRPRRFLIHDGNATGVTLEQRVNTAVLRHDTPGSEAVHAAQNYAALDATERAQLLAFLDSLGRREFDHDGDDAIEVPDLVVFAACYGGSGYTPDDACAISDVDPNGAVDLIDLRGFVTVYGGAQEDCDGNGVGDLDDIANGAADANANLIPDVCESDCAGDLNADGTVGVLDLLDLLAAWGVCPACLADIDGDGTVNVADLLVLLANWGPCDG